MCMTTQTGKQCQRCGNDYDPRHPCPCRSLDLCYACGCPRGHHPVNWTDGPGGEVMECCDTFVEQVPFALNDPDPF